MQLPLSLAAYEKSAFHVGETTSRVASEDAGNYNGILSFSSWGQNLGARPVAVAVLSL
jgi:hypothetical protein